MSNNECCDGFYYGYSPSDSIDPDGRPIKIDARTIVGRFIDTNVIDVPASREAGRSVYKTGIILETRRINGSQDISAVPIRFNRMYRRSSCEAIERFPEAWKAYQAIRKTPVSDEERTELELIGISVPDEKPKRVRKPKAKNVFPLTVAS